MRYTISIILLGILFNADAQVANQQDSIKSEILNNIAKLYTPLIFQVGSDVVKIERQALSEFGQAGEQVVWEKLSLFHYLEYQRSGGDAQLDAWVKFKRKIQIKYPSFIDAFISNNDAWFIFENSFNRRYLNEALKWSQKAILLEPQSGNWKDTYANILHKLNRTAEAIKVEEEAIALDSENPDIKLNLKKMREGQSTWPDKPAKN